MGIAGHVSKKILQHYSHVRMEAKRDALDALSMKPVQKGDSGDIEGLLHKLRHKTERSDGRDAASY
jgi:hypothetical protein